MTIVVQKLVALPKQVDGDAAAKAVAPLKVVAPVLSLEVPMGASLFPNVTPPPSGQAPLKIGSFERRRRQVAEAAAVASLAATSAADLQVAQKKAAVTKRAYDALVVRTGVQHALEGMAEATRTSAGREATRVDYHEGEFDVERRASHGEHTDAKALEVEEQRALAAEARLQDERAARARAQELDRLRAQEQMDQARRDEAQVRAAMDRRNRERDDDRR